MNVRQKVGLGIMVPLAIFSIVQTALSDKIDYKEKHGLEVSDTERAIAGFGVVEIDTADVNNLSRKIQTATEQLQKQIGEQNIYYHKINK